MKRHTNVWLAVLLATGCWTSAAPAAEAPAKVAAQIDRLLTQEMSGASTSGTADTLGDEAFLRRVSLDLVGELPTAGEVTMFAFDPSTDKRARAVDRLLADPRFGTNWSRYWRDVIYYRRQEDRALLGYAATEEFLADHFHRNTPWNEIASEFITATGDVQQNGATALMLSQMGEAENVAAEVSRIFMGVQIQCAQCHDHPYDRWKREEFHEFAAFFPRIDVRQAYVDGNPQNRNPMNRTFVVASRDNDFRRFGGQQGRTTEHFMPDLNNPESQGTQMAPEFFATGQKLPVGITDERRRNAIADWLTSPANPWFAKAYVNRVWAELTGEGFYEPVDDLGPDRECSAPETMEYLAAAFTDSGYDVKWLYRTIMATRLYQQEAQPRRLPDAQPFAANAPQPLRADQVYDSLVNTLGLQGYESRYNSALGGSTRAALASPRSQFGRVFGYDPSDRRGDVSGSIPQALVMMNSNVVTSGVNGRDGRTVLGQLLREIDNDSDLTVELYLHCLAREPNDQELAECVAYVKDTGDRTAAFEDIFWALLNSTEFLHRN